MFSHKDKEQIKENGVKTGASYDINATDIYFHRGITWTTLTISKNSFRFSPVGCVFDSNKGPMLFSIEEEVYYLASMIFSLQIRITLSQSAMMNTLRMIWLVCSWSS